MKPAPFEYHRPTTVDEAVALLDQYGDEARPLAGGQSLVPAMNFRLAAPAALVDLNWIPALQGFGTVEGDAERDGEGGVEIRAMARQSSLERDERLKAAVPLFAEVAPHIAHPQIRSRGTVGGSIAHSDPAAELPAACLALGARMVVRSVGGERLIDAGDFFVGLMATALRPGELLVAVRLPPASRWDGFAFEEFARRHGDFALVGVAATVSTGPDGAVAEARVALCGHGPVAERAVGAEEAMVGVRAGAAGADRATVAAALEAASGARTRSDVHASAEYRRHLVQVLTYRALSRALARAVAGTSGSTA